MNRPKPLVLCILDGLGIRESEEANALKGANTPTLDHLFRHYPMSLLDASESHVGLPNGQMGNSEVGHTAIGAGRVIAQDLPKITAAIEDQSLFNLDIIKEAVTALANSKKTIHIMGLCSDGGVHALDKHMIAIYDYFIKNNVTPMLHLWADGRDTPPKSAEKYIKPFMEADKKGHVATLSGRYYAMDRDQRWDRINSAFNAMVFGKSPRRANHMMDALETAYTQQENDEFITPTVIGEYQGMKAGDAVMIVNFRADRARQMAAALFSDHVDGFAGEKPPKFSHKIAMCAYDDALKQDMAVLFPPIFPENSLGEVLAQNGLKQLRIAETEKYAHVTYFFNGGKEALFQGEERILVNSPKVSTYDLQPEMAAGEVVENLLRVIEESLYDVIIVNFANPDMVGHTGLYDAAVKAVEAVDHALAMLIPAILEKDGALLVTADHGNVETMRDPVTGEPHTAHSLEKVPFILVQKDIKAIKGMKNGCLIDIAPTMLDLLDIALPKEMTGHSLILY